METDFNLNKSANQLWKESKTTLTFKDWLNREKSKEGVFIPNKASEELLQTIRLAAGVDKKTEVQSPDPNKIFGLNKWVTFSAILIVGGALVYNYWQKKSK